MFDGHCFPDLGTEMQRLKVGIRKSLTAVFVILLGLLVTIPCLGQEGQPSAQVTGSAAKPDDPRLTPPVDYVIGPEDVLEINVLDVSELSGTYRVANDGTISLPLIGLVRAAGLSAEQLRQSLQVKWGKTYLQDPQVSVFVRDFHANPISVIGSVEKPGLYYLAGPKTLIDVLAMAGGLSTLANNAAGPTLVVTRAEGFQGIPQVAGMNLISPTKLEIGIHKLLYSRDAALNINILPLDSISVSRADVVYVVGAVKNSGAFALHDQSEVTVLQALAMAGGTTGTAAKSRAEIIHRDGNGGRSESPVDLKKIFNGKQKDAILAADDILFVPDSTQKAAGKRGVDAVIATVSGFLIFHP